MLNIIPFLVSHVTAQLNLNSNWAFQTSTKCRNREPGSQPHPVKTGSVRHIFTICFKMIRIRHQFFFTVPDRMIYIKCAWKTIIPLPLPSCRQLLVPMHKFNLWRPLGQFHSKSKSKVSITHSNQVSQREIDKSSKHIFI